MWQYQCSIALRIQRRTFVCSSKYCYSMTTVAMNGVQVCDNSWYSCLKARPERYISDHVRITGWSEFTTITV